MATTSLGVDWNPSSECCVCPDAIPEGLGLVVPDLETLCPKILEHPEGEYPAIAVAQNGSVTLQSGSVASPIDLTHLQEITSVDFEMFVIKGSDGIIRALKPISEDDGIDYVLVSKNGQFSFVDHTTL